MGKIDETEYWVPEHVREYLRGLGFHLPLESMEGFIREWHEWMQAAGNFYNYSAINKFRTLPSAAVVSANAAVWTLPVVVF